MRKIVKILGVLLLGVLFVGCNGGKKEESTLAKIKEQGYFTVGLDDTFAPMGFKDDNGNIVGFDIDLAKEAAKKLGVEARFKGLEWDGAIFELKGGKVDMIWNGMTITPEREENATFSTPYFESGQIIMTLADSPINKISDLKGKVVGTQLGSTSYYSLEKATDIINSLKEMKKYGTNVEALMDLEAGRLDAVVIDTIVGKYYGSKKDGTFKYLDEKLESEDMGVAMRPEDKELIAALNKVLDEMKEDGTFDRVSEKWFGKGSN